MPWIVNNACRAATLDMQTTVVAGTDGSFVRRPAAQNINTAAHHCCPIRDSTAGDFHFTAVNHRIICHTGFDIHKTVIVDCGPVCGSSAGNIQTAPFIDNSGIRNASAGNIQLPPFIKGCFIRGTAFGNIEKTSVINVTGECGRICGGPGVQRGRIAVQLQTTETVCGKGRSGSIGNVDISAVFHDPRCGAAAGNVYPAETIHRKTVCLATFGNIQKTVLIDCNTVDNSPAGKICITMVVHRNIVCGAAAGDIQIAVIERGVVDCPTGRNIQSSVTVYRDAICRSAFRDIKSSPVHRNAVDRHAFRDIKSNPVHRNVVDRHARRNIQPSVTVHRNIVCRAAFRDIKRTTVYDNDIRRPAFRDMQTAAVIDCGAVRGPAGKYDRRVVTGDLQVSHRMFEFGLKSIGSAIINRGVPFQISHIRSG